MAIPSIPAAQELMRPRPGYDSRLVWLPAKSDAAAAAELAKRPLNDREKKSRGELKRHWYEKKVAIKMILWALRRRVEVGPQSLLMSHGSNDRTSSFPL